MDPLEAPVLALLQLEALPVDRGRKLNVHKTFRRRPGRLLNVLCTFNFVLCLLGYHNHGKNVCKLFQILAQFPFTTSE